MTPIETVKKLIISQKLPYFSVKNNNQLLYRQIKELSPDDAAQDLEEFINGLSYSWVDVTLSQRSPDEKGKGGANRADFTHRIKLSGVGSVVKESV